MKILDFRHHLSNDTLYSYQILRNSNTKVMQLEDS